MFSNVNIWTPQTLGEKYQDTKDDEIETRVLHF